jgi:hypothetical protein
VTVRDKATPELQAAVERGHIAAGRRQIAVRPPPNGLATQRPVAAGRGDAHGVE